jgi:hypothetical protein
LAPKIANDQLKFYTIQVWDTCAEDGDVVDIIVDGVVFASVALKHAPTSVSIPCGEGSSIGIGATHDGGGGVTLGVSTSAGQFFTPILRPGETLPLGVSF